MAAGSPSDPTRPIGSSPGTDPTLAAPAGSRPPSAPPTATVDELLSAGHTDDLTSLTSVDHQHFVRGPELARGGMGRILYGRDLRHGRPVAIKELLLEGEVAVRRFEREALITARLEHPSIVPVYQAGRGADGRPFYAMRMVSGRALHTVIAETQTFEERMALLPAVIAVADAMGYAHARRIVHRDLKPANILVGRFGETVIIDWGLAKDLGAEGDAEQRDARSSTPIAPGLTHAGAAMGTPAYMPPEQAAGQRVDARADVYAIGATLYHVLAGLAPFGDQQTDGDLLTYVLREQPTPLAALEPRVPADLRTIVTKAIAREPAERYDSAQELAEELRQFQRGNLVDAYAYSRTELARRWFERHRKAVFATLAALALAAVAASWFASRERELRGTSDEVARLAERRRLMMLREYGRTELLAGRPLRALALLGEAFVGGLDDPPLRAMIADAARPLDAVDAVIEGPGVAVHALAVYPDGTRIATATDTGAYVRNLETGEIEHRLVEGSRVWSVDLDDAGARLVYAPFDKPATIVDARSFETIARLPDPVDWAALSPDGAWLLTLKGPTAAAWRASDGTRAAASAHPGGARAAAITGDGAWLLSAGSRGALSLTRVSDGSEVARRDDDVRVVRAGGEGPRFLTGHASGDVALWSAPETTPLARRALHRAPVTAVERDPTGARIATTSDDGTAVLADAATLEPLAVLRGHRAAVTAAAFSSDGALLVTAGRDGSVRVWSTRDGRELLALEVGALAHAVGFHPWGGSIVAGGDRGAGRWTLATGRLIERIPGGVAGLKTAAFSPGGERMATAGGKGAALFDREHGERLGELAHDAGVAGMVFSADGARLLTTSDDHAVQLWDADSGLRVARYPHDTSVRAAAFSDGEVITVTEDGAVRAWPAGNGDDGASVERGRVEGEVGLAAIASAANVLLTARDQARSARLYRLPLARDREPLELGGHGDAITALALSPDGSRAVTAARDSEARIWRTRDGQLIAVLAGHHAAIGSVAFGPGGARVITASDDGTARLWNAATGALTGVLDGHAGAVAYASFTPEGTRALTLGDDGDAIFWDTHLDERSRAELRRLIERRVPWRVDGDRLVPAR